jgi:hypothetical protein
MPTIIDSLLVKFGMDDTEFRRGQDNVDKRLKTAGKTADETGKKLKKTGADAKEGFDKAASSAVKFLAIIGGTMAIKNFISQQIEAAAALDRLSKNLDQNVSTISAWSNATEIAGGTAAGLQGTMEMLSRSQTELMLTGQSGLIPYFSALGLSMADAQGKAKPVDEILLSLADKFARMDRPTANNMGKMMGIDPGTMNLLLRGRGEVEMMIRRQKEYTAVTKNQAEAATRVRELIVKSRQDFEAFGRRLMDMAMPALEKLFQAFDAIGNWMHENSEFVQIFLGIVAAGLVAIGLAVTPINLAAVAVLALAAGIALLYQDYLTFKRGGDSLIDWGKWEPGFKAAGFAIKWIRGLIGDLVYRAVAAADILGAVWNRDWKRAKFAFEEFKNGTGPGAYAEPDAPTATGGATKPAAGGGDSEAKARAYFQAQGWTKEQAAGLAANIKTESDFSPSAVGDSGQAYGLAQWHPDRQAEFKKKFGKDIKGSSLEDQLAFMHYELTAGNEQGAGNRLKKATSAADAAGTVSRYYERPRDADGEAAKRGALASRMLAGIPGASSAAAGAGAAQTASAGRPAGNNSIENHIGEVKIYTAATDAPGIAKDMGKSMDYLFTANANYGLF